ncbi:MAG: glycosyltransferase [Acidimicrobiia bacterium]
MPFSEPTVTLFGVMCHEPRDRLQRLFDSLENQDFDGRMELVLAAPEVDHPDLHAVFGGWTGGLVRVVANPSGSRTLGLNAALDVATAEYAVRVDARSRLAPHHVRRCVQRLAETPRIGVVGGHQIACVERDAPLVSLGIARALQNRLMLGNAAYRNPGASGAVDTVYLGAYRTAEARAIRYDERLDANEDFDLCRRYRNADATVWLEPGLDVKYEPRHTWSELFRQYRTFGRAKVQMWRTTESKPNARQYRALLAAGGAAALLAAGRYSPAIPVVATVAGLGVILTTDQLIGAGSAPVRVRIGAVPAHVAIELGWIAGIGQGCLSRRARPDVR